MDAIFAFLNSLVNSNAANQAIDAGLSVANKLPEGVGNGAALLIFFFLLLGVPIFWMAISRRTGEWQ